MMNSRNVNEPSPNMDHLPGYQTTRACRLEQSEDMIPFDLGASGGGSGAAQAIATAGGSSIPGRSSGSRGSRTSGTTSPPRRSGLIAGNRSGACSRSWTGQTLVDDPCRDSRAPPEARSAQPVLDAEIGKEIEVS